MDHESVWEAEFAASLGVLVGRERECEVLARSLRSAASGTGSIVLLKGEPGVGKSRLVREVQAHAGTLEPFVAECFDGEQAMPFRCWRDILSSVGTGDDPLGQILASTAAEPPRGERFKADDQSDLNRLRLFDAILAVIAARTRRQPAMLVFEDLHWADPSSIGLLRHIARRARRLPLLILATYRDALDSLSDSLRDFETEVRERRLGDILAVSGLSTDESAELARLNGSPVLDGDAARDLQERTGGNPFFIEEVVRHAHEAGQPATVPPSVIDVVSRRLASRAPGCIPALRAGAVLGQAFAGRVVEAMIGKSPSAGLEDAVRSGLVVADGPDGYRFRHALVRRVLLESLQARDAQALHLAAAEALQSLGPPDPEVLARHYRLAHAPQHVAQLLAYSKFALVAGLERYAWDETRELFEATIVELDDLGVDPVTRSRFLAEVLPRLFQVIGLPSRRYLEIAEPAATVLLELGENELACAVLATVMFCLTVEESLAEIDPVRALEVVHTIRRLTSDPWRLTQCDGHEPWAVSLLGDMDTFERMAVRLTESEVPGARVGGRIYLAGALSYRGLPTEAAREYRAAWEATAQISPRLAPVIGSIGVMAAGWAGGTWSRFRAPALDADLPQRELGLARQSLANRRQLEATLLSAKRESGEPVALGDISCDGTGWSEIRLLLVQFRSGHWERTVDRLRAILRSINPEAIETIGMVAGHLAECCRHVDPALAASFVPEWQLHSKVRLWNVVANALRGLIAAEMVDYGEVRNCLSRAETAMTDDDWLGLGARVQLLKVVVMAVDGDYEGSKHQFAAATSDMRRVQHPWDEADAHYVYGKVLMHLRRPVEAQWHFDEAIAILERIAAAEPFFERVRAAMPAGRSNGAGRVYGRPAGALSAREGEVLALIAEGRSNREIAAALVISEATVATHVRHILEKTGTDNRTEAAAFALRCGLAGPADHQN